MADGKLSGFVLHSGADLGTVDLHVVLEPYLPTRVGRAVLDKQRSKGVNGQRYRIDHFLPEEFQFSAIIGVANALLADALAERLRQIDGVVGRIELYQGGFTVTMPEAILTGVVAKPSPDQLHQGALEYEHTVKLTAFCEYAEDID